MAAIWGFPGFAPVASRVALQKSFCESRFSHTEQTKAWSERPKPGQRRSYPGLQLKSSSNIFISCFGNFFSWAPWQLAKCAPFWFSPTFWRNVGEPPYTVCRESENVCTWVTEYHVVHTRKVPTDYVQLNLPSTGRWHGHTFRWASFASGHFSVERCVPGNVTKCRTSRTIYRSIFQKNS